VLRAVIDCADVFTPGDYRLPAAITTPAGITAAPRTTPPVAFSVAYEEGQ
jgi:hypothetical protein